MKSMTGFGSASGPFKGSTSQGLIEVTIRAVNGRFLEPRFHLPREYLAFEAELKKTLQTQVQRGTVDVFVSRKLKSQPQMQVRINESMVQSYKQVFTQLAKKFKIDSAISIETLMRLPEVLFTESQIEISRNEEKALSNVFSQALGLCMTERKREGQALRKELVRLSKDLQQRIGCIAEFREKINDMLHERYKEKIKARLKGQEVDPQRLSQEIVIQIDKSDITEELNRLDEHLKNYQNLLLSQETEGKKLDFYTQELLREMNTIGSKSQLPEVTQAVVESKTLIERLREQVQNVE